MSAEPSIAIHTELWLWRPEPPGKGAWHFVTIAGEAANVIRARAFELRAMGGARGFGAVRVRAAVAGVVFETSVFPQDGGKSYLLPVKAEVRGKAGVGAGDVVAVEIWV